LADLTLPIDRVKTVTERLALIGLELPLSEQQIPQVEISESGARSKEVLQPVALRVKQARFPSTMIIEQIFLQGTSN
jgi:hypothetical protein